MSHRAASTAARISGGSESRHGSSAHAARASRHQRGGSEGSGGSNGSLSTVSNGRLSADHTASSPSSVFAPSPSASVITSAPSPPSYDAPRFRKPNKHYRAHLKQRIRATLATADSACVLNDEQFGSHDLIMTELRVWMSWFER